MTNATAPMPSWDGLLWTALPVLGVLAVLAIRRLGQVRALSVAAVRMTVQLLLLGVVLEYVFATDSPWVVVGIGLLMLGASAQAVGARQSRTGWLVRAEAFAAMLVGVTLALAISTRLALGVEPWYEPSVIVPLTGMILGNSVNGLGLAADRFDAELRQTADLVERRLALGASSTEAMRPALRAAVRAAFTPILTSLTVAGIVAVPGMATGQILAGAEPTTALRYQIMIYLAITTATGTGVLGLLALRARHAFTGDHQLRPDFLRPADRPQ